MERSFYEKLATTLMAWSAALLMFFPIFWMLLSGFKTEIDAITTPPLLLFEPTFENYEAVHQRANYLDSATNSVLISAGATSLALVLAIPAAYAMAFFPTRRTRTTLLWMLSTKMLPPVSVLVPTYILFREIGFIDTRAGLMMVYALSNLPIVVWLLYAFFKEVPADILEAGRLESASPGQELWYLLMPMAAPGAISTALLSIILCWNEAFWSLNLTTLHAAPLTAFIASFSAPEGLFWAKLSAASTMAIAPILILGWLSQRQLVRGLTFGAVK
jgi:sorbitol/mannitol transport system permease protein